MRIAMITDSYYPTRDGVVTSLEITKRGLEDRGHQVFIVAPDPGKDQRMDGVYYFRAVKYKKYEGYFLPIFPSNKIEILQSLNIDVIHIHGVAVMALKGMLACRTLKKPAVLTFHTMVGDTMRYYSPINLPPDVAYKLVWIYLRNLLKRTDAVVTPTPSIAVELKNNGVNPRGEIAVIPTGVDTEHFNPNNDCTRLRDLYKLEGRKVVVHIGRISFEKNIDIAVKALKELDDNVVMMIVGKGPAKEDVKKVVKENGLDDRVIFTGFVPDAELPEYYAVADVAVSASKFETQGLSILEAMSSGVPVACVNERAFKDIVKDGENGFLFQEPEECAEAIRKCIDGGQEICDGARNAAMKYSIISAAEDMENLYKKVIDSKKERLGGKR